MSAVLYRNLEHSVSPVRIRELFSANEGRADSSSCNSKKFS